MKATKVILGCLECTSNALKGRVEYTPAENEKVREDAEVVVYTLHVIGERKPPQIAREAKWKSRGKGRRPIEWDIVIKTVLK